MHERVYPDKLVIGSGRCYVYLFYYPTYRSLASVLNHVDWPCKLGMGQGHPDNIDWSKYGIDAPEKPETALIIKTDDFPNVRFAIDAKLRERGKLCDSPSGLWYRTTPEEVTDIYLEIAPLNMGIIRDLLLSVQKNESTYERVARIIRQDREYEHRCALDHHVAYDLILTLFSTKVIKYQDGNIAYAVGFTAQVKQIKHAVEMYHIVKGGWGYNTQTHPVDYALQRLKKEGIAKNIDHGVWSIIQGGGHE